MMLNGLNVGLITLLLGLYGLTRTQNILKMVMCLSLMSTGIILFFVSVAYIPGGTAPVIEEAGQMVEMVDALPQSVMVTAIVIDLATTSLGLAMVFYLFKNYGTLNFSSILKERIER